MVAKSCSTTWLPQSTLLSPSDFLPHRYIMSRISTQIPTTYAMMKTGIQAATAFISTCTLQKVARITQFWVHVLLLQNGCQFENHLNWTFFAPIISKPRFRYLSYTLHFAMYDHLWQGALFGALDTNLVLACDQGNHRPYWFDERISSRLMFYWSSSWWKTVWM